MPNRNLSKIGNMHYNPCKKKIQLLLQFQPPQPHPAQFIYNIGNTMFHSLLIHIYLMDEFSLIQHAEI